VTSQKRILVVDDDQKNRNLVKTILDYCGYGSELARDGIEALEKLDSRIDLVLLDVMMPGIDGFEVARRIRAHCTCSDVPIVMLTILTGKEDRLRAVEAGANDYLSKPIDRLELQVRLASLLKMKEAQDAIKRHRAELEQVVEKRTAALRTSEDRFRSLYAESKKREELYQSFLTSSADAIVIYDLEGRTTYVNPSFTRMFGWTLQEVHGKQLPYVPDSERQRAIAEIQELMQSGTPKSGIWATRYTRDGRLLDVSLSASRYHDHQGKPAGILVILRDITTSKRMEEALRESEQRFRTLFETSQDCMFVKDRTFTYTDVNDAMIELLGIDRSTVIGKTDEELFTSDYASHTRTIEPRVLEGQTIESQQTISCKSSPITLDFIRFPVRDTSGRIAGICGIARDITERTLINVGGNPMGDGYESPAMKSTLAAALLAAETDSILLITGESGSGKDHLARYIHDHSSRSSGSYYAVNCAAIPEELAESELFGHEAGAFTGAGRRKRGLFELAESGTLLLNEVAELSPILQAKLLTFLDTFTFTRVGGEKPVTVNARLIAATNRELEKEVAENRFRKDLFYRLNVFSIRVPPLRDRLEDIPVLVGHIVSRLAADMQLPAVPEISSEALERLCRYTWPGNVRELRNVLERALIVSRGGPVRIADVAVGETTHSMRPREMGLPLERSLVDVLAETERELITRALSQSAGKKHEAARLLGISRFALSRHMSKLAIPER
jgi:two-component system, NtrC family, response regulator AtoC